MDKDVNIFNVSFLDILSGALAAVIMLFIVMPRVDLEDMQKLQQLEVVEQTIHDMEVSIKKLKSTVPAGEYQSLIEQTRKIQATIGELERETEKLQGMVSQKSKENKQLAASLDKARAELNGLEQQIEQKQKQIAKLEKVVDVQNRELAAASRPVVEKPVPEPETPPQDTEAVIVEARPEGAAEESSDSVDVEGMFFKPPLMVMIEWDGNEKVHLYMKKKDSNMWCFYQSKRRITPFGRWATMPRKFMKKPHETIVQNKEIVPGEYEIHAQVASKGGEAVKVYGRVAMYPPSGRPQVANIDTAMLNYSAPPYHNKASGETLLGELKVTETDIFWTPKK